MSRYRADLFDLKAKVVHETPTAYKLAYGGPEDIWLPKSLVENNRDGTLTMPRWLAVERGLI
ncbi:hypothetical protein UFOVP36_48 [uncultured Caudovirales phage]|uniref:Uncharacterized protein n=1 Tax=uncultured Caudovirales phage TaxID=2100421 RepID=A0A6J5KJU3_9CAUD|nr:hypothetical protein UFOVP36_48 [uncultured Caudovirales phage]